MNKFLLELKEKAPGLQLPPPTMEELGIDYLSITPGKEIRAKIPFKKKFTNPAGLYQGGFLTAALDEVFGPLAFVTYQGPCLTLSINVTFLKSFHESMKECFLEAEVVKETRQFIFMRANVIAPDGEIIAFADSHVTKVISKA